MPDGFAKSRRCRFAVILDGVVIARMSTRARADKVADHARVATWYCCLVVDMCGKGRGRIPSML